MDINLEIAQRIAQLPPISRDKMMREIGRINKFLEIYLDADLDGMNDFQVRQILEAARSIKRDKIQRLRNIVSLSKLPEIR